MLARFHLRRHMRWLLAIATIVGLIPALPALATVTAMPVRIRLAGPPRAAEPGQPFSAVLEVASRAEVEVEELFINTGRTWRIVGESLPSRIHLVAGETRSFPFTVTSPDPSEPFFIEYQLNGDTYRKSVDVSPEATTARQPGTLQHVDDPGITAALRGMADDTALRPDPSPTSERRDRRRPDLEQLAAPEPPRATADYNVRVVGYFHYRRMNDGAPVGVDGAVARVYDEDSTWDEHLATQVLGPDGRLDVTFNWDPCFGCDGTPDLYVEFELDNAEIAVQEGGILEVDYTWETGVWNDFGGTFLDIGNQTPGNAAEIPACHVMVNAMRAWRFAANTGRDTPKLDIQWPESDPCGACYNPFWEEMYLDNARVWNENTITHEFGHHFVNAFATYVEPNYCVSGFCDPNPPDDCGHCEWCRETTEDAFSEGFPSYFGNAVMRTYAQPTVTPMRAYESVAKCGTDNQPHDPWETEGWVAAMLLDIDDANQDDDPTTTGARDELNLGFDEIFYIVDMLAPTTPAAFITRFNEQYPALKEQMWATAANNGFQYDATPPGKVTNITSDHTLNEDWDTRAIIKWFWNRAPDDASGIAGYSIWVQKGILPGMPDAVEEVGDVTQYVSGPHTPGWYYISIRAKDRSGKWSDTYETAGPFGIRAADPANLKIKIHSNWDYLGVTARHVPDATPFSTHAPSTLDGTGGLTYLSAIYNNSGEQATNSSTGQYWTTLFVDGVASAFHHRITPLQPFEYEYVLNKPVTVTGGRHIVTVQADETGLLPEPDELDNYWARQWAWVPPYLPVGPPTFAGSPPFLYANTEWIVDGSVYYENCRGFRVIDPFFSYPATQWMAMTLHAPDGADYDLFAYGANGSPTTAFSTPFASSVRGTNGTDVILMYAWGMGNWGSSYDFGITNYSGGSGGFYIQKSVSATLAYPSVTTTTLAANEMLKLYQFDAPTGRVLAHVKVQNPALGQVYLSLVPSTISAAPLLSAGALVASDPLTGEASIEEPTAVSYCLAVWRDRTMGTGPLDVTVTVQSTPSDPRVATPAGWAAPLVPRPANDGTPGAVPAPAVLFGDAAQTWFNYALSNSSPVVVPPNPVLTASLYVDGVLQVTDSPPAPGPNATVTRNLPAPQFIAGGRHTLGLHLDSAAQINEMTDANNTTAGQWVWQPATLPFNVSQTRPAPRARFAGWELMPPGAPLWFNLDGLRTPTSSPDGAGNGWKVAALAMPDAGVDVDIKLFEASTNAAAGFDTELAASGWGIDQVDFVITDFRVTAPRPFDVGFLAPLVQSGTSIAEVRRSINLGPGAAGPGALEPAGRRTPEAPGPMAAAGIHGPFTVAAANLFELFEVDLPVGTYEVRLTPGSGSIDWGFGLYPPGPPFASRSGALPGGTAWEAPAGAQEVLHVTLATGGLHTLVVWKNRRSDVAATGTFTVQFSQQSSGVVDAPTTGPVALISGITPNPFARSTRVTVELALAGGVEMQIYDLSGRQLSSEDYGWHRPGRYDFEWNGLDAARQPVPAGIYFLRMIAGSVREERKIVRSR